MLKKSYAYENSLKIRATAVCNWRED